MKFFLASAMLVERKREILRPQRAPIQPVCSPMLCTILVELLASCLQEPQTTEVAGRGMGGKEERDEGREGRKRRNGTID